MVVAKSNTPENIRKVRSEFVPTIQDVIDFYDEGGGDETPTVVGNPDTYTLGDAISAGFYGNTSNAREDGKPGVTPSLSPGPKVLENGEVVEGSSIGDFNQAFGPAGQNCSQLS